jgi:addiction module RelE/StbE family toxin
MKIRWSPRARDQALEIFEYIADDRPEAAAQILEGFIERVRMLAEFPDQGQAIAGAQRGPRRSVLYDSYRIVYRVDRDAVLVLAVRPTRRDSGG